MLDDNGIDVASKDSHHSYVIFPDGRLAEINHAAVHP